MANLIAVDVNAAQNHAIREKFERYRNDVVMASRSDHLVNNYSTDKFRIDDQLGTVVILSECSDQIVGFQSVYRPTHWPVGAARVGNRSWIDPKFRSRDWGRREGSGGASFGGGSVVAFIEIVYQETQRICDAHEVELAIITRQRLGALDRSMFWLATRIKSGDLKWTADTSGYYLTYDAPDNASCWQRIMYTTFKSDGLRKLQDIPRIMDDVYEVRFGRTGVQPFA